MAKCNDEYKLSVERIAIVVVVLLVSGFIASSNADEFLSEHYLGCFYNNGTQTKDIKRSELLNKGNQTFEHCIQHCKTESKSYTRLQNGSNCECLDELGLQVNDSLCNKTCGGNPTQRCGGTIHTFFPTYVLYTVCPIGTYGPQCQNACHCEGGASCNKKTGNCPNGCRGNYTGANCNALKSLSEQYIGCYRDTKPIRALPYAAVNTQTRTSMSWQRCTNLCSSKNYSFSGTQYYYQCFCGESYGTHGPLNEINCNMNCTNSTEKCGDSGTNSVLHTCPSGFYGHNCAKVCNCQTGRCLFHNGTCQKGACKLGWTGDKCYLRECNANNGSCDAGELCVTVEPIVNRTISVCRCPDGYVKTSIGGNCTDIDECTEYPGICGPSAASCDNMKGGYACRCRNGETVNNSHCKIGAVSEHYVGCFHENETLWNVQNIKSVETVDSCIYHCFTSNQSYARLLNNTSCQCGNESGIQLQESACNIACKNSSGQSCSKTLYDQFPAYVLYTVCPIGTYGSQCRNACHCEGGDSCNKNTGNCPNGCHGNYTGRNCSVLKSLSEQYIGCYRDKGANNRAMSYTVAVTTNNNYMSLQWCTNLCSSKNYSFSGTQYRYQCFCGESYDKHGTLKEINCSTPCRASTDMCGGGDANSVLHSCPSGYYGLNCAKVCNCHRGRCFFHNGTCQESGCESGWTGDACSLRDCNVNNGSCDAGELCVTVEPIVNRTISVCRCPDGYGKTSIGGNCTDIDECTEYPGICGPFAVSCDNIKGGYACRCRNGETVNNSHCKIDAVSEHYVGCFHENETLWNVQNIKSVETVDSCINHCFTSNQSYARLLNNTKCLCADENGIQLQESACNIACNNSSGQNCSGTLYDQFPAYFLYTVCPIGFYGVECKTSCNCKGGIPCDRQSGKCPGQCNGNDTEDQCNNLKCGTNYGNCTTGELCVTVEPIRSREISVCQCQPGFWRKVIGGTCTDVDECSEMPDICGPYSRSCSNTEGSYTCYCQNGNNITASLCTSDINECTDNPGICGPYGKSCVNTEGSFTCHCLNGSTVENSSCSSDVLLEHYLGCFYNNGTPWQNRTESGNLAGGEDLESGNRTFDHCIEHCKKLKGSYSYAKIQSGSYCECVDESGLQVNDSLCNKTCGENSPQHCDGMMFNLLPTYVLYAVCPFGTYGSQCEKACHCEREVPCDRKTGKCPCGCHRSYTGKTCNATKSLSEQYIGCYGDKNANRSMSYTVVVTANNNYMSLQWCTDFCSSANYSFSGPQYGYECYCGESYERHGKLSQETCNMTCSGNKNESCGGPDALSVYHSCPFGNYGRNCSKICNCEEGRCFFQNGTCQVKGCKPGWTGNTCALRDCNVNNGSCDAGELCVTVEPIVNRTISVCRCPDGYGKTGTGANCTDIDECLLFPGICGPHSRSCGNNEGSYNCQCRNGEITNASACTSVTESAKGAENVDRGVSAAAVIVPILLVVVVGLICLVLYIYKFRQPRKKNSGMNSVGMTPSKRSPESDDAPIYEVALASQPISTDALPDFIKTKLSAPNRLQDEFKSVPQETKDACSTGQNPSLKQKNRFKNIIPYNHNRVILKKVGHSVLSDYINASHIATFNSNDKFIATQGPKPETVNDFWRLICEQNVGVIVMITNLVENQKAKCEKYWPDVGSRALFGEMSVETQSEERYGDYISRRLLVENEEKSLSVIQWHFVPWPDHGVPSDVNSFLTFRRRVRRSMTPGKSVVVHCSAGAGRTGCFIAIDYLLEQERSKHSVDIYGCLQHLRKMRCQMVQTFDQYQFIHQALLLSVTIGETSVPTAKFAARLRELNTSAARKRMCPLDIQHQMLNESRKELSGINYSRVLSMSSNTSKISELDPAFTWGWKRMDAFITLDPPSAQTFEDFYELCTDYKCTVIIVIDTDKVLDKAVFPSSTKEINCRQQAITCGGSQKQDFGMSYKIYDHKASDDTYANFGQFDIYANTTSTEGYGNGVGAAKVWMNVLHVTESLDNDTIGFQSLISLHRNLKQLNDGTEDGSTIVMSRGGYELSGYCLAALNAFDMSADEKEVDVFQIVREIMKSRDQFDFSLSAFKELHSTVAQFIQASH